MENKNFLNKDNNNKNGNKPKMFRFNLTWMYALIFIMLVALYLTNDSSGSKEMGWTEFQGLLRQNAFKEMVVYNKKNLLEATVKPDKLGLVFKADSNKVNAAQKVFVKIPSADKFSEDRKSVV